MQTTFSGNYLVYRLLYNTHGNRFFMFFGNILTVNIISTSNFSFAVQKTQGSLLQNERFGDYLLARSIYEFILATRAYYFLNVDFAKIHGHLFSFRNIHIVIGNGPFKIFTCSTFLFLPNEIFLWERNIYFPNVLLKRCFVDAYIQ